MRLRWIYIFLPLLLIACNNTAQKQEGDNEQEIREIRYEYGIPVDSFKVVTGVVQSGETLGGILNRLGAPRSVVNQLSSVDKEVFDVRQIRQGKKEKKTIARWF